jgi:hypothetical protein
VTHQDDPLQILFMKQACDILDMGLSSDLGCKLGCTLSQASEARCKHLMGSLF